MFEVSSNTLSFPDPIVMDEMVRAWRPDQKAHIGAGILPMRDHYAQHIRWFEKPARGGMTKASALNTEPKYIGDVADVEKIAPTAAWKEAMHWGEEDLLNATQAAVFNKRAGEDMIAEGINLLQQRLSTRLEWLIWQVLTTGTIVVDEDDVKIHATFGVPAGNFIDATAAWDDFVNADPIKDFRAIRAKGRSLSDQMPTLYMNSYTLGLLEENSRFIERIKQSTLALEVNANDVKAFVLRATGGIRDIIIYDGAYLNDDGTTTTYYIPDNLVVAIYPPAFGQPLGNFYTTPSLFNGTIAVPRPGAFMRVKDKTRDEFTPFYDVMMGIYGLPVLKFPSNIIVMDVKP